MPSLSLRRTWWRTCAYRPRVAATLLLRSAPMRSSALARGTSEPKLSFESPSLCSQLRPISTRSGSTPSRASWRQISVPSSLRTPLVSTRAGFCCPLAAMETPRRRGSSIALQTATPLACTKSSNTLFPATSSATRRSTAASSLQSAPQSRGESQGLPPPGPCG
eukprot:Amastigsp_a6017_11.p2 type:complete len:164 gc:universal Amastigsp_a6017_11:733-1224(+)